LSRRTDYWITARGGLDLDLTGDINDIYELICELERRGVTRTSEQSKTLEVERGIKILPYHITEVKYRVSRKLYAS
jgi:hypothetical protein